MPASDSKFIWRGLRFRKSGPIPFEARQESCKKASSNVE